MKQVVWKKQLDAYTDTIDVPQGSKILCLKVQYGVPTVWFLANPEAPSVTIKYKILGTGHQIEDQNLNGLTYLDSFLIAEDTLVFHVFMETP